MWLFAADTTPFAPKQSMQAIHLAISLLPLFSHAASEGDQT
ncbi:MAG: hypothetical protein ACI9F9_002418, partial [Candidatus Paceibacteria bacterium]